MKSAGDTYEALAEHFLAEQRSVLGEQAARIADGVSGVRVREDGSVDIEGDGKAAIDRLSREFRDMFGANVESSVLSAVEELDHPIDPPSSLDVDRELRGYAEYRDDGDWYAVDELVDVEPQPGVWSKLFGFGPEDGESAFDGQPIAERRGVPLDASEAVYDAWIEQKRGTNGPLMATGHTWITAAEIPDAVFARAANELVSSLLGTSDQYGPDRGRLVVWLQYTER